MYTFTLMWFRIFRLTFVVGIYFCSCYYIYIVVVCLGPDHIHHCVKVEILQFQSGLLHGFAARTFFERFTEAKKHILLSLEFMNEVQI